MSIIRTAREAEEVPAHYGATQMPNNRGKKSECA